MKSPHQSTTLFLLVLVQHAVYLSYAWTNTGVASRSVGNIASHLGGKRSTMLQPDHHVYSKSRPFRTLDFHDPPASSTALSAVPIELWTSFLPPTIAAFIRYDYVVSYAYGLGTSLTALAVLKRLSSSPGLATAGSIPACFLKLQSAALVFYGIRLCLFLFVRNLMSKRIQEIQQRIEDKWQGSKEESSSILAPIKAKLKFLPLALSCGLLYYGLCSPLLLMEQWTTAATISISSTAATVATTPPIVKNLLTACMATTWFGFGIAALGDFTKTYVKRRSKNEDTLVTGGVYSIMRHPNYTGEIIGWTANSLAGIIAAIATTILPSVASNASRRAMSGFLAANFVGWLGIVFVLLQATRTLEMRQKEKYGSLPEYDDWISSSWGGWMLPPKKLDDNAHELKVEDVAEEGGTGI